MASITKFNAALTSVPNELTFAAANFNFDFSLMKVEAPKEFHGLRDALSTSRRLEAEEGLHHVTARKLGALFETIIPVVPHLIKAYGKRASEISSTSIGKLPHPSSDGLFAAQAGPDGTNIWAAATSGKGAIAVHLLACMLARIWNGVEATSVWVELVERRRKEIFDTYHNTDTAEIATIMAAQQTFPRHQLASWDSSARAWLQTADASRRLQQTQLMLIINNVRMPVNTSMDIYESVVKAWRSAMCAVEALVQGIPQRVQDGAVLLGISSWHLYPNMVVLGDQIKDIDQKDDLLNAGGILTIALHGASSNREEGVFWSLPLARMRYYTPPVLSQRRVASDTSRITMGEFHIVVLGAVIGQWSGSCPEKERCLKLIIQLSKCLHQASQPPVPWLELLADAANMYIGSSGVLHQLYSKLLGLGIRRHDSFLNELGFYPLPFFGLEDFDVLLGFVDKLEDKIAFLRKTAQSLQASSDDIIIRYLQPSRFAHHITETHEYASALPVARASLKRSREHAEQRAKGHCRWTYRSLRGVGVSCGEHCACLDSSGPPYMSTETGSGCIDMRRSRDGCCNQEPCQVECIKDCPGGGQCGGCYNRIIQSAVQQVGEQNIFIGQQDVRSIDIRHFQMRKPQQKNMVYEFLLGDLQTAAIFKRADSCVARYVGRERGAPAMIDEIEDIVASRALNPKKLQDYLMRFGGESSTTGDNKQRRSLDALVDAASIYKSMTEATVVISAVKRPLYKARWSSWLSDSKREQKGFEHQLAGYFACIAMFESGDFDIDPLSLQAVMALSIGDSIYVMSALLADPSEDTSQSPIRRIFGNLGRPEMALLVPPANPRINDYDPTSWQLINHSPFDGQLQDCFQSTSLHLSFTDFEMPVDVGARGLRDTQVIILESLVSINDRGKHIGDLDIFSMFKKYLLPRKLDCSHQSGHSAATHTEEVRAKFEKWLVSIDCWEEFLDLPNSVGIFRASGNWQARLAATVASIQRGKITFVLPKKPCLQCIKTAEDIMGADIIVA